MSNNAYDPLLAKYLRDTRPDWFPDLRVVAQKDELRRLAESGANRPAKNTKLSRALNGFLTESNSMYDPEIKAYLRERRPDWFPDLRVQANKDEIRRHAESGADRPSYKTKLGRLQTRYTASSQDSYDPAFRAELETLRPDWFT